MWSGFHGLNCSSYPDHHPIDYESIVKVLDLWHPYIYIYICNIIHLKRGLS